MSELFLESVAYQVDSYERASDAVARGDYDRTEHERSGQTSVAVSPPDRFPPDLACGAARRSLASARAEPTTLGVLMHCVAHSSGVEIWNSAAYVAHQLGLAPSITTEVRAASNGALVALELASARLRAAPQGGRALITTADTWHRPRIDRWRADHGLVFGDAGTATVLSTSGGVFRLRAICTRSDPRWEGLHRGSSGGRPAEERQGEVDLARRAREFFDAGGDRAAFFAANRANLRSALSQALHEAEMGQHELGAYVLPFFGRRLLDAQCVEPLGIASAPSTVDLGLRVGHTGAGDQIIGLRSLLDEGRLSPGASAALIGVGAGFSWTAAIVERVPDASSRPGETSSSVSSRPCIPAQAAP